MFRGGQLEVERLAIVAREKVLPERLGFGASKDCKAEALSRILRSIALWITRLMRSPLRVTCEQSTYKT